MSVITKGFNANTVITRGFFSKLKAAVDVAIESRGRRPEYKKKKKEKCIEYHITVELLTVNQEDVRPIIKNKLITECERDIDLHANLQSINVNYKDNARDEIVIKVKCLTEKQPRRKK